MMNKKNLLFIIITILIVFVVIIVWPLLKPGIKINSPNPETIFFLNGEKLKKLDIDLKPGEYQVIGAMSGYKKVEKKINIGIIGRKKINFEFKQKLINLGEIEGNNFKIIAFENKFLEPEYKIYYLGEEALKEASKILEKNNIKKNEYKIDYIYEGDSGGYLEVPN